MKMADMKLMDEVFTHFAEDGTQTAWNATRLFEFTEANDGQHGIERWAIPIDDEHAQYCMAQRGVENDRIEVFLKHPEYLKKPILFVALDDGSHLLVDGTHRYVTYWALKVKSIPGYIVPYAVAKQFIIEDAPKSDEESTIHGWSGLSVLREMFGDSK